jgi:DNA polymerase III subunit beta
MSRESFPELPEMPEKLADIPIGGAGFDDLEDDLRHLDGGVAFHAERRAAAAEAGKLVTMVATDGHRLAMVDTRFRSLKSRVPTGALLPRKAMQEI